VAGAVNEAPLMELRKLLLALPDELHHAIERS
jgi:hypothetical protein